MNQDISPSQSVLSLSMQGDESKSVDRELFVEKYAYDTGASAAMHTNTISMSYPT